MLALVHITIVYQTQTQNRFWYCACCDENQTCHRFCSGTMNHEPLGAEVAFLRITKYNKGSAKWKK